MRMRARFDPVKDVAPVDQTGFLDLAKAYAGGSIPAGIPMAEERYNNIEDPRSIAGRPSDVFEAMQANKAIVGYKPPKKDE